MSGGPHVRDATEDDLPALVAMLADDPLGAAREDATLPLAPSYRAAFEAIRAAPNQRLVVLVEDGRPVGTLQLLLIPALSRKGSTRGLIEGVRIVADRRGERLGERLVAWAIGQCRAHGCVSVQLTSDAGRVDAHRFWERLGFEATHRGFKLELGPRA